MTSPEHKPWPFHAFILLVLAPAMALAYLVYDNSGSFHNILSRGQTVGRDFAIFWSASVLLWRGEITTIFDPSAFQPALEQIMGADLAFMPFPYPPNGMIIFAPLALFAYPLALVLWLGGTCCLAMAVLWRRLDMHWLILVGFLLSPASIVNISTGQNGYLSAALLGGGLLLLERRPVMAGILLGLLSYKPQLGILIPPLLMVAGHWRAFAAAALTVIVLALGSVVLLGLEPWLLYLTKSGPQHFQTMQYGTGFFQLMSPTYFMTGRLLGFNLEQAWLAQICGAVFAVTCAMWAFRQKVRHDLKCAVAMIAVFLVSPYVLTYDMTIVAIAILVAARCFVPNGVERGFFALAWLLPLFTFSPSLPMGAFVLTAVFVILLRQVVLMSRQNPHDPQRISMP